MIMRQPNVEEGKEAPPLEGEEDEENLNKPQIPVLPTYSYVCIRVSFLFLVKNIAKTCRCAMRLIQLLRCIHACQPASHDVETQDH